MSKSLSLKYWGFRLGALFLVFCGLLAVEGTLRIFKSNLAARTNQFRINAEKTSARRYSAIKEPDPDLMWRLKPGSPIFGNETLNNRGFRTAPFTDKKPPGTHRIVILGDSRSFGFGVPVRDALYGERIGTFLKQTNLLGPVEVINLSVIGYSSYQGSVLWKKSAASLDPDTVIIWFGFNDLLYYHVMDHRAAESARLSRMIRSGLNHLYLVHWLRDLHIRYLMPQDRPIQLEQVITRRVPPPFFRDNLESLIQRIRKRNARVILLTSPVRPGIPMVLNSRKRIVTGDDGRLYARLITQYEIEKYWLMDATVFPGPEAELDRLLDVNPDVAILHYFKGRFFEQNGQPDAAAREFALSEELDETRRTVAEYNDIIRDVARSSGATLVDLVPVFGQYDDLSLFVDDCHPGMNGHGLIAGEVIRAMTGIPSEVTVSGR
ncbi:MAG TPA: SGNH/GDSL hydrolase family protein [bacterium]|nr:SGNH/GDSL hydrolase family protein [bacterium]